MILDDYITVIRNAIKGDAITTGGYIAIGTGTTAATGSDTTLETEVDTRKTTTNGTSGDDTATFSATWAVGDANGNTITEVGVSTASTGGTFLNRQLFPGFSKTSDYELRVQVYIKSENS